MIGRRRWIISAPRDWVDSHLIPWAKLIAWAKRASPCKQKTEGVDVVLYGKAYCPLCDEAERRLLRLAKRLPMRLRKVDITQDDRLFASYREQIPVVEIAGEILFVAKVSELRAERAIIAALENRFSAGKR